MPSPDPLQYAHLATFFLVPDIIALFIRSRFVPARTLAYPLLAYLAVSLAYHGLALSLATLLPQPVSLPLVTPAASLVYIFAGPAILGLTLVLDIRFGLIRRLLTPLGIQPIHAIPTAWDWKFNGMEPHWILVTFKDSTRVAGYCGRESFISSDPSERDIYIVRVYDVDDNGTWIPIDPKVMLITHDEISMIEFTPCHPEDTPDAPHH